MIAEARGRLTGAGAVPVISDVFLIAAFATLMWPAAHAKVEADPVPYTLQVLMVLLTGLLLGPWRAGAAMALYAIVGFAGAPVFARGGGPAYFFGSSAGYIYGFVVAAVVVGLGAQVLSRRAAGRARRRARHLLFWRQPPRPVLSLGHWRNRSLGSGLAQWSWDLRLVRRHQSRYRCGHRQQRRATERGTAWGHLNV